MKRKVKFGRVLLIYICLWILVIIGVSAKLWKTFGEYQKQYVEACENANPDILMEQQIKMYQSENIRSVASSFINEVNEYETSQNIQAVLDNLVIGKKISYERDENFTNRKPLYVVKADDQIIGYVSMKQENESDRFGFHKSTVDEMKLDTRSVAMKNIIITVPENAEVEVNHIPIASSYQVEEKSITSFISQKAQELTGQTFEKKTYRMDGFLAYPAINVKLDGEYVKVNNVQEGSYSVEYPIDKQLESIVAETVLDAGKQYVLNTNQMAAFQDVVKYLKAGSDAYQNVQSVQSGLTWAGKPDQLEILDANLLELHQYSDEVFTAKTYYKIHRLYRDVSYEEEMVYEWLLEKINDNWVISNFSLVK